MSKTVLGKITDADGIQRFLFVTVDPSKASTMVHTTPAITESEMRQHFKENGMPNPEIDATIAAATPV